jgi:WD40 repeat protein
LEHVQEISQIKKPDSYRRIPHIDWSVLEDKNQIVATATCRSEGTLALVYDISSGDCKQVYKGESYEEFLSSTVLRNPDVVIATTNSRPKKKIVLIDLETGRPSTKWETNDDVNQVISDPTNPNVFFAHHRETVIMFDRNQKQPVRTLCRPCSIQLRSVVFVLISQLPFRLG